MTALAGPDEDDEPREVDVGQIFSDRLAALRKKKGLTRRALAEAVEMSLIQIGRYETGASQPTLDAIRKLAIALGVSADALVFGEDECGPDNDLHLQFEALFALRPR